VVAPADAVAVVAVADGGLNDPTNLLAVVDRIS
jgi:hypothetical protein